MLKAASAFIQLQILQNLINVDDDDEKEYNVLKKNQASLLTKNVSIHLVFFFLMKVAAQVPCWFHEYKFTKMYPTFMSLEGVLFWAAWKRLSRKTIWSMGFEKSLVSTLNSMYRCGL